MFQEANTDLFNPLVPKAQNSVSKSTIYSLQIKPKASLRIFISCTLGTNGLS